MENEKEKTRCQKILLTLLTEMEGKMIIDRKFKILAVNPCSGSIHTEEDSILFTAKDKFLPKVLDFYQDQCKAGGADENHILSIQLLKNRVKDFQKEHDVRIPDTSGVCEIDRCIHGLTEKGEYL